MAERNENGQGNGSGFKSIINELPFDRLGDELRNSFSTLSKRAVDSAGDRITDATSRLTDISEGGPLRQATVKGAEEAAKGGSPVKGALKGGLTGAKDKVKEKLGGGSGGGGGRATKSTNIIEEIDIGAPVSVVYNQWTQFQDYSDFMKKVDGVEQEEETKVNFKAQVFWSHRKWDSTIKEQIPDQLISWRSQGDKGHVDGTVTFHELAPRLTRVLVVLEYYPQGFMERTGNIWRAQGRRARLELKHFRRHVMMNVMHEPEELEGWRGEIHDSEVVRSHEEVVEEEERSEEGSEEPEGEYGEDEYDEEEYEGEYEGEPAEEEGEEPEAEYEEEGEEPEAEYEGEPAEEEAEYEEEGEEPEAEYEEEPAEEEPEAEYEEEEEEPAPRRRRRRARA